MNRNFIVIALILLLPLCFYWGLTRKNLVIQPSIASNTPEIIKFSSPMCFECQELEQVFDKVYPAYDKKITLRKIDVTNRDNTVQSLIKEYDVKLVPTTVFKDCNGKTRRIIRGTMPSNTLENYMRELLNG